MKLKKFNFLFFTFLLSLNLFSKDKDDVLAGSVVKSERWEINRDAQTEIFQGSVSFRNALYELKADKAVFYREKKLWEAEGSVYCLRKFEDGTSVESYCDKSTYSQNMEKAKMESSPKRVKSIYFLKDGRKIITYSRSLLADNYSQTVIFENEFEVISGSSSVYGEKGIFNSATGDFLIKGANPSAFGENEKYKLFMEADSITLNRDTSVIKAENKVRGYIINKVMEK